MMNYIVFFISIFFLNFAGFNEVNIYHKMSLFQYRILEIIYSNTTAASKAILVIVKVEETGKQIPQILF